MATFVLEYRKCLGPTSCFEDRALTPDALAKSEYSIVTQGDRSYVEGWDEYTKTEAESRKKAVAWFQRSFDFIFKPENSWVWRVRKLPESKPFSF